MDLWAVGRDLFRNWLNVSLQPVDMKFMFLQISGSNNLAETSADYIIFTDGDCIPMPDFISQHRALAERGWFLVGSRILLSKPFTDHVLKNRVPVHTWTVAQWIRAWVKKDINRWLPILPLPVPAPLRKLPANKWEGATTCNLGYIRISQT